MRPRRRAGGLLVGALVLFAIGTNIQAGWLYVLAALLLGAVLAGLALPVVGLHGLSVELHAPEEVEQGAETFVDVRITNRSGGVRWAVRVVDDHLDRVESFVTSIRPQERVDVTTMRVPGRRGPARTSQVQVRSAAPFGVAERRRHLPLDPPVETLVLPSVVPLGSLPFIEPVRTTEPAAHRWPRRGTGPEYLGIREYRTGDSMRHVHWGLTARHGQVMVREFEEERTRRLAIVVDTERDLGGPPTPLDRCCTVAASVLDASATHGSGARLLAGRPSGEVDILVRAEPKESFRWLALLEPGGARLSDVLRGLGHEELRGVDTLLVATPAWRGADVDGLAEASEPLVTIVARLVVVPIEVPGHEAALEPFADALRGIGADLRPWRLDDDLAALLATRRLEGAVR